MSMWIEKDSPANDGGIAKFDCQARLPWITGNGIPGQIVRCHDSQHELPDELPPEHEAPIHSTRGVRKLPLATTLLHAVKKDAGPLDRTGLRIQDAAR